MKIKTTADVLQEARSLLASGNWIQGAYREERDGKECYCALGAVAKACGIQVDGGSFVGEPTSVQYDNFFHARDALELVLSRNPEDDYVIVQAFNDAKGRTLQDVLCLFDDAIESCDYDQG